MELLLQGEGNQSHAIKNQHSRITPSDHGRHTQVWHGRRKPVMEITVISVNGINPSGEKKEYNRLPRTVFP